jgi:hypothetical protein
MKLSIFAPKTKRIVSPTDPASLGIFERLDKHPETFSDEDLKDLTERYEGQILKGKNAQIPIKAALILDNRNRPR